MNPCHEAGCDYPKKKGKQKCEWHWLKKQPMEEQIKAAEDRFGAAKREGERTGLTWTSRPRVSSLLWPDGERWCAGCQQFIPLFYCTGSRCKAHAAEASHNTRIQAEYGIDRGVYLALLESQGGRCYVCRQLPRTKRLAVDHDHKTGEVRGLLCADMERGCNHAVLGSLEARSVDGVIAAAYRLIDYMQKTPYQRFKEANDVLSEWQGGELSDDDGRVGGSGGPPPRRDGGALDKSPGARRPVDSGCEGGAHDKGAGGGDLPSPARSGEVLQGSPGSDDWRNSDDWQF